jgi:hypothetical protein
MSVDWLKWLKWVLVLGCFEHGNEASGCLKGGEKLLATFSDLVSS